MSHRIWNVIFGALSARQGRKVDRSLLAENFSREERETVEPYVEFVVRSGPPWPLASLLVWAGLGAFVAFTGLAVMATKSVLMGIPPVVVGLALVQVARKTVYPRKKRQKELYATLLEEPRRLLDPEYRSRFDELLDFVPDVERPDSRTGDAGDPSVGDRSRSARSGSTDESSSG